MYMKKKEDNNKSSNDDDEGNSNGNSTHIYVQFLITDNKKCSHILSHLGEINYRPKSKDYLGHPDTSDQYVLVNRKENIAENLTWGHAQQYLNL